jgi:AcrR family transcriptional regulator
MGMVGTRDRIITATGELFRRQGYNGTSLKQVTTASGAPTGSLFHFFPGGKEELADAVLRTGGAAYRELYEVIADAAPDPARAVTDFFDGAAAVLEETGYLDACPIGTVALEVASTNDRLRQATADVFASWIAGPPSGCGRRACARNERSSWRRRWWPGSRAASC